MASSAGHFGRWNSCVQRQGDTTMTEVIRPGCEWRVRQGRGQCDAASPLPDPSVAALAQDGAASASKEPSVGGDPEAIDLCAKQLDQLGRDGYRPGSVESATRRLRRYGVVEHRALAGESRGCRPVPVENRGAVTTSPMPVCPSVSAAWLPRKCATPAFLRARTSGTSGGASGRSAAARRARAAADALCHRCIRIGYLAPPASRLPSAPG
jgi:hypothetical protein